MRQRPGDRARKVPPVRPATRGARLRWVQVAGLVATLAGLAVAGTAGVDAQPGPDAAAIEPPSASSAGALALVPFKSSPFPYEGMIPESGQEFLDVTKGDRRGHTSPRGGVLWEDQAYSDTRTLVFVPKSFRLDRPGVIVLYLHGNLATLQRDVVGRQRVPHQLVRSGLNAVLLAPQFATNALDSSAGHFWDRRGLARFLDEASAHLAGLYRDHGTRDAFARLPVVVVAYSGGYLPAAFSLQWGGVEERIRGVILLDALFGEEEKFADWILRRHSATFFFSGYSDASRELNGVLRDKLAQRGIEVTTGVPGRLDNGTVAFLSAGRVDHNGFVSHAWSPDPLADVLSRVKATAIPADTHDHAPTRSDRRSEGVAPSPPRAQDPEPGEGLSPSPPASPFGTLSKHGPAL